MYLRRIWLVILSKKFICPCYTNNRIFPSKILASDYEKDITVIKPWRCTSTYDLLFSTDNAKKQVATLKKDYCTVIAVVQIVILLQKSDCKQD